MIKFVSALFISLCFLSNLKAQDQSQQPSNHPDIYRGIAKEVLQTSSYTYLLMEEGDSLQWIAVPKMDAKVGHAYIRPKGMEMVDFKSTQLNRTFESVLFIGGVVSEDTLFGADHQTGIELSESEAKEILSAEGLDLKPIEGAVTIAELFGDPDNWKDKMIRIRGKVTKYSPSILSRNWIHLQDGTQFEDLNDLVITSTQECKLGDIVIVEGKVTLNKDFGHGYFYEVIIEDALLSIE